MNTEREIDKLTAEILKKTTLNYGEAIRLAIFILKSRPGFDENALV